jgi:hypothetical protein
MGKDGNERRPKREHKVVPWGSKKRRKNGKLQKEERKKGPCTKRGTEG